MLETGTGNINGTGGGTNISDCVSFMTQQQSLCTTHYGATCKVFGYLETREPTINNAVVDFRVFPAPTSRMSSGVCEPSFATTRATTPVVSSGPQFIVSQDQNSLVEDCNLMAQHDYLQINSLGSYVLTGIESLQLTDLQHNSALINFKSLPK